MATSASLMCEPPPTDCVPCEQCRYARTRTVRHVCAADLLPLRPNQQNYFSLRRHKNHRVAHATKSHQRNTLVSGTVNLRVRRPIGTRRTTQTDLHVVQLQATTSDRRTMQRATHTCRCSECNVTEALSDADGIFHEEHQKLFIGNAKTIITL